MATLSTALGRALRRRCPQCGAAGLFESWLRPKPSCPACGQPIERHEEGYHLGSLLVNLVVAELLPLAAVVVLLVATWPHPPWNLVLYGGAALAIVSPFAFYPYSKLLWLAIDQFIQPTIDRTIGAPSKRRSE